MTTTEDSQYEQCLKNNPLKTDELIFKYKETECSTPGMIKIMFFLYFFRLFKELNIRAYVTKRENAIVQNVLETMPLQTTHYLPHYPHLFAGAAKDVRTGMQNLVWCSVRVPIKHTDLYELFDANAKNILEDASDEFGVLIQMTFMPLLARGLYIGLSVFCKVQHPIPKTMRHAVVLCGMTNTHFIIKNSWGSSEDILPISSKLLLNGLDWTIDSAYVSLLVEPGSEINPQEEEIDAFFMDEYIGFYTRWFDKKFRPPHNKTQKAQAKKNITL
jgi:hypothetical protein